MSAVEEIRYTLLGDGPSDDALLPLLTWVLRQSDIGVPIQPQWADLLKLPRPPRTLNERIRIAVEFYPCDLLFVHRDAERQPPPLRYEEIVGAITEANRAMVVPPHVCVVPVRMTEAWFLFDEQAIRQAAGNPNGKTPLSLPKVSQVKGIPDPKEVLYGLLRDASGLQGRRLKRFTTSGGVRRVASSLDDFHPLRSVASFLQLEQTVKAIVQQQGWV